MRENIHFTWYFCYDSLENAADREKLCDMAQDQLILAANLFSRFSQLFCIFLANFSSFVLRELLAQKLTFFTLCK